MCPARPSRARSGLLALVVTFLWSTSWVLIKWGLDDIPALAFAGLRYAVAVGCLAPLVLASRRHRRELAGLTAADWARLSALAVLLYTVTQGAQFVALAHLPAQTTSLLLSFSPVMVALAGVVLLAERPTRRQWAGVGLYLVGAAVFLHPVSAGGESFGMAVAVVGMLASAGAALAGRAVNRGARVSPVVVTVVSMGIGAAGLLAGGVATQGLPPLDWSDWLIVGWLAVVNTAVAFTLWNLTQRALTATESSVINSTMLVQIAILAWLFLDEHPGRSGLVGLSLAAFGVLLVQLPGRSPGPRP